MVDIWFHQYTFGRSVHAYSDHKPLQSILRKLLAQAPRRLQGMLMRLQKYNIEVSYERGKNMLLADLLSRAYLPTTVDQDHKEFGNVNTANRLPMSKSRLDEIRVEAQRDEVLQALQVVVMQGWPNDKNLCYRKSYHITV